MLRKLLKYDFRSLYRPFVLTWSAALALALITRLTLFYPDPVPDKTDFFFAQLFLYTYLASLVAMVVVALVLVIQRFYKGIWGNEGYLLHPLPVRSWQILLSKLISAAAMLLVSILVGIGSFFLLLPLGDPGFETLTHGFEALSQSLSGWPLLTLLLSMLSDIIRDCLLLYLAMAIGHLFSKGRLAMSAAAFLVLLVLSSQLMNLITGLFLPGLNLSLSLGIINSDIGPAAVALPENMVLFQVMASLISLAFSAVYFCSAAWILDKKLNLE